MDAERREFFRVMVRLPVSCAAVSRTGRTSLMVVRSVDLSAGGVKVVTEHELVPGNRVRVAFRVDDDTTAKLDATVRRTERLKDGAFRYAIDFDPVDRTVEQRLMRAVYAQEQVNAGRHKHVRMSVWQFVRCRRGSGQEFNAHALQLSADDAQIITHQALREGERLWLVMADDDLGFDVETHAVVGAVETDMRGNSVATVEFDGLDRITRSRLLRRSMEQERREIAGE
jgi:c-di-GMP-binding flagellar brake protein YcgR